MISDLCNISDCLHVTPKYTYIGLPMVRVTEINNSFLELKESLKVSSEDYNKYTAKYTPQRGDIILARVGAFLGEFAYVDTIEKFCIGQNTTILNPKKHNKYIYYNLISPLTQLRLQREAAGSAYKSVGVDTIKNFIIELPDDEVQTDKIGDFLFLLDSKIQINKFIIAELEAMAKTIYDYWFMQFDFPNADGKPYRSSGGEMVWNEDLKREIPSGWRKGTLFEISNITMGQSPNGDSYNDTGNGMVFYQGRTDFGLRFPSTRMYTTEPSRIANQGDILLSVRAPVGDLNISNEKCCIGRGLAALNSKTEANSFVYYLMTKLKPQFDIINNNGTTFGALTKDMLNEMMIIVPADDLVEQFESMVSVLDAKIASCAKENLELTGLRDWLLPMLMNGQATVE
ncbi:restriction endonuclease subunit S [Paenibacillus silvisoli]|uniref:restriction endonuclease subunit S n=1 Tax=Paenibacillus silvisoli TaxID=3110539 RepID=UPI002803FD52|nr:restriction endonuclease subunit S [Paenibacillus silvisoli]